MPTTSTVSTNLSELSFGNSDENACRATTPGLTTATQMKG